MSTPKIALCLSGQLRMVEECYPSIYAGLIEGYDVDTFIHAWYNPDEVGKFYSHGAWHDTVPGMSGGLVKPEVDKLALDQYKPKAHLIEPQRDFTEEAENCLKIVQSHVELPEWGQQNRFMFCPLSMFYSIWQANELRRQYEQAYDVVVRCRFDMLVNEKVRYEDLDLSKISTSWTYWAAYGGVGDCIAVGTPESMDRYSSVYSVFEYLCTVTENPAPENPEGFFGWGTEALLAQHLKEHGIEVNPSVIQAGNVRA